MIECKSAIEEGLDCVKCCLQCDKVETCSDSCEKAFTSTMDCSEDSCVIVYECGNQVEVSDELQVMNDSVPVALQKITEITIQMDNLKKEEENFRQTILEAMEKHGIKKFENEFVSFTYVEPTTRSAIDSKKLKDKYPDIAKACTKISEVSASVRIKVK